MKPRETMISGTRLPVSGSRNFSSVGSRLIFLALLAGSLSVNAQSRSPAPNCDDLVWSAQVLAANPDIRKSCRGVYVRNNVFFAKVKIEVKQAHSNRISFRPLHTDGSMGPTRSIPVGSKWRASIDGQQLKASELEAGQQLSIYIPEDRFALAVDDVQVESNPEMQAIENAEVVPVE